MLPFLFVLFTFYGEVGGCRGSVGEASKEVDKSEQKKKYHEKCESFRP